MRLSKSRFTTGLQCHRQLWWRVHEPDAPELEPDAAQQAIFDQGSRVGRVARERVPGGVLIDLPYDAIAERVEATKRAMEGGAPAIYEASFLADDTFAAVDILERVPEGAARGGEKAPRDAGGTGADADWALIEVKSTTHVKPEHLPDVAVQLHVLRRTGLRVVRAELMHLDRECTYPDLENLFAREDVTTVVEPLLAGVPEQIGRQLRMLEGPIPSVPIGRHCDEPYECPFKSRCWPPLPEHHIGTLYYVGVRKWELEARGFATIRDLPEGFPLHPAAERQRRAIRAGGTVVEPGLAGALAALHGPLAIVDFETVAPAIPVWNGCHPYDAVPAQFSCHAQDADGRWTHHEWIAQGAEDPRPELVRRLAAACAGARTILAYYADFERTCLRRIAESLPELRGPVEAILSRLVDALPLVRDHVYHLGFEGSFSLKSVLPALVPELGYEDLEIAGGLSASRELERLMLDGGGVPAVEQARLREALRRYCERDTWGVVKLLERLEEMARAGASAS